MKIKPIQVTRSMVYTPESYLELCEEDDEEPTQEGFRDFIDDWIDDDFNNDNGTEEIFYLEEDE